MASITNISNGIKEHACNYQNCNSSQLLIFGRYVKVRESLYVQVVIWIDTMSLNHINTRVILPRYESSSMIYRPKLYGNTVYTHTY